MAINGIINNRGQIRLGLIANGRIQARAALNVITKKTSNSAFLTETEDLWARLSFDPGLAWKNLYNELISRLISCGVWNISDVIRYHKAATQELGLFNLKKNSHNAMAVNSPAFIEKQGFDSDGVSAYIDENYKPSVDAMNLSAESQTYYIVGDFSNTITCYIFGTYYADGGSKYCMLSRTPAAYSPWGLDFYQPRPAGYDNYILAFSEATTNTSITMVTRVGGADVYVNSVAAGSASYTPSLPNEYLWSLGTHYYGPATAGIRQKIWIAAAQLTPTQIIELDAIRDWWNEQTALMP